MHYVATCLYSLGEIMADTGEYNGARRNFEQALELREIIFGPQHENVAEILSDLGFLCNAMGDTTAALDYLKRALPVLEVALPTNHPEIVRVKELIAQLEPPKNSGLFGRFHKN